MSKELLIYFNDEESENPDSCIEHVRNLISEGYTSGYYPTWELKESETS